MSDIAARLLRALPMLQPPETQLAALLGRIAEVTTQSTAVEEPSQEKGQYITPNTEMAVDLRKQTQGDAVAALPYPNALQDLQDTPEPLEETWVSPSGKEKPSILVADSDHKLVEMLTTWLRTRGYKVAFALNVDTLRRLWMEDKPDLVILNVWMEGEETLVVCRELKAQQPALVMAMLDLSVESGESLTAIEVRSIEAGADAFLAKPFLPKQLLAHIHALNRRLRSPLQRQPSLIMDVGPIHFDVARDEVTVNGRMSRLTPTENRILQILAANTGDVCTLNQIVSHAWGYGDDGATYLIKAHIRHLREKIETEPTKPRYIRTVPGVGYVLRKGDTPEPSNGEEKAFGIQ